MPKKILLCEDEPELAAFVRDALVTDGYEVKHVDNGDEGLILLTSQGFDGAILDIMLPGLDGLELLRRARSAGIGTPILILTAKFHVEDRIEGLDAGANDYLVKPFALGELLARVRVLMRWPNEAMVTLTYGELELDPMGRRVTFRQRVVFLSSTEFSLLHLLMRNQGKVLSRAQILDHVWDDHGFRESNVVDVYVNYLRTKLDPRLIRTVRNAGYVFGDSDEN